MIGMKKYAESSGNMAISVGWGENARKSTVSMPITTDWWETRIKTTKRVYDQLRGAARNRSCSTQPHKIIQHDYFYHAGKSICYLSIHFYWLYQAEFYHLGAAITPIECCFTLSSKQSTNRVHFLTSSDCGRNSTFNVTAKSV